MAVLVDTRGLAPADSAEAIFATLTSASAPTAVEVAHGTHSVIEGWQFSAGVNLVNTETTDRLSMRRTARHLRVAAPERISLGYNVRGICQASHLGHGLLRENELQLLDLTSGYETHWDGPNAAVGFNADYTDLGLPVDVVRCAIPRLRTSPLYELTLHHLRDLPGIARRTPAGPALSMLGAATVDLVRALVAAIVADPTPIATVTVPETVAHLEKVIAALPERPVIMGHSFGGTLTQLLLDRGHGAAGVVIDSAPPEGIRVTPPSQIRSLFPILNNPAKRHQAAGFTPEQFHYAFTNTLSEEDALAAYERYAIPAPGSWVWSYGLIANLKPGRQETWVDFRNERRAPLLFIAGGADHIMPPSVNKSNAHHYRAPGTVTEYHEFPGRSHWTCGEPGWEQVADHALDWALRHAG